jgi:serine/threonine protein kinase
MSEHDISQTEFDPPSSPGAAPSGGEALDDPRVVEVVGEYLERLEQGLVPERGEYLNRYPELAAAIGQCLDGLEMVRAAAPKSSPGASRSAGGFTLNDGAFERAPRSLGDFQIIRELGRGGMAVVYEALQLSLGRRVALKVLPFAATFDARQLQRFKNEAQAAALLHHTNIVPIYAVGCERGVHFYAMQLIEGQSLAVLIRQLRVQAGLAPAATEGKSANGQSHLSRGRSGDVLAPQLEATDNYLGAPTSSPGPTSTTDFGARNHARSTSNLTVSITSGGSRRGETYFHKAARLIVQAADALEHAHQLGIVHRDIKPANLLVNTAGTLWVADFGLAQFQADVGLTRTGDMLGTFRYMSPEQAGGQRTALDHRTDIYSLGATFYELLTLQPVFAGETRHELLFQILHTEPRACRAINRAIPAELETIALKALGKAPGERYATAAELADDIRRFLDDRPILARPPSHLDRLRKWSRRHPSAVIAGVLLLAFGVVGLVVSNWMIAAEQRKTAVALEHEKRLFGQAKDAVNVLIEVSEEELANSPFAMQTRKRLLQTALTFYEDFIEQRRGDAASQAELAAVQDRVKGILQELNLLHRDMQVDQLRKLVVLAELDLSGDQEDRLKELLAQWNAQRETQFAELEKLNEEARRRAFVEIAQDRERLLGEVLSPQQERRLRQIAIQSQGLSAFKEPEIVEALELTPKQRSAIRDIEREAFTKAQPFFGRRFGERRGENAHGRERDPKWDENREQQIRQIFKEAIARVIGLFSTEQVESWTKLTGAPVVGLDDKPPRGSGGPGGPEGPPGGGPPRHRGSPPDGGSERADAQG